MRKNKLYNAKADDNYYIMNEGNYYRIIKKTAGAVWTVYYNEDPQKIYDFKMANSIPIKKHNWIKFWKVLEQQRGDD